MLGKTGMDTNSAYESCDYGDTLDGGHATQSFALRPVSHLHGSRGDTVHVVKPVDATGKNHCRSVCLVPLLTAVVSVAEPLVKDPTGSMPW